MSKKKKKIREQSEVTVPPLRGEMNFTFTHELLSFSIFFSSRCRRERTAAGGQKIEKQVFLLLKLTWEMTRVKLLFRHFKILQITLYDKTIKDTSRLPEQELEAKVYILFYACLNIYKH